MSARAALLDDASAATEVHAMKHLRMRTCTARVAVGLCWLGVVGCADPPPAPTPTRSVGTDLETASAHTVGLDGATLVDLAHWVRDTPELPIFSILISRH